MGDVLTRHNPYINYEEKLMADDIERNKGSRNTGHAILGTTDAKMTKIKMHIRGCELASHHTPYSTPQEKQFY